MLLAILFNAMSVVQKMTQCKCTKTYQYSLFYIAGNERARKLRKNGLRYQKWIGAWHLSVTHCATKKRLVFKHINIWHLLFIRYLSDRRSYKSAVCFRIIAQTNVQGPLLGLSCNEPLGSLHIAPTQWLHIQRYVVLIDFNYNRSDFAFRPPENPTTFC